MSDNEEFFLVGVVHPIIDGPCLCTPVFRSAGGKKYFIQNSINGYSISDFTLIDYDLGENLTYLHANVSFQTGNSLQYGVKWIDQPPLVFDLEKLHSYFINYYSKFAEYPYLFFQMAFLTNDAYAITTSIKNKVIQEAIKNRTLKVALKIRKTDRSEKLPWSDAEVSILELLWRVGYSTKEIALSLGRTRNAVISMAKRLKLRKPKIHSLRARASMGFVGSTRLG